MAHVQRRQHVSEMQGAQQTPNVQLTNYILDTLWPHVLSKANKYPQLLKLIGTFTFIMSLAATVNGHVSSFFEKLVGRYTCSHEIPKEDTQLSFAFRDFLETEVKWKRPTTNRGVARSPANGPLTGQQQNQALRYSMGRDYYFWYNWRIFKAEAFEYDGSTTHNLSTFGFSRRPIEKLLDRAWSLYNDQARVTSVNIWKAHRYNGWRWFASKDIRPMSTIDFDPRQKAELIADIEGFLTPGRQESYRRRGIPYRRGYLFHGPPGTGKSSLSFAIAGHLNVPVNICALSGSNMSDEYFAELMQSIRKPSVLLLEDIDSAGIDREDEYSSSSGVTLSGVLNALDGIAALDGCVVIMTTNTPDALDPALIRPGRIDVKVAFHNADRAVARTCFVRMLEPEPGSHLEQVANHFADAVPEFVFSPAELQGYLIRYINDASTVVNDFQAFADGVLLERARRAEKERKKDEQRELERLARAERDRQYDEECKRLADKTKRRQRRERAKKKAEREAKRARKSAVVDGGSLNAETKAEEDSNSETSNSDSESESDSSDAESSKPEASGQKSNGNVESKVAVNGDNNPVNDYSVATGANLAVQEPEATESA